MMTRDEESANRFHPGFHERAEESGVFLTGLILLACGASAYLIHEAFTKEFDPSVRFSMVGFSSVLATFAIFLGLRTMAFRIRHWRNRRRGVR